jgi:hypothetical protein
MDRYPAATHISLPEWLALIGILGVPLVLIGTAIYLVIRVLKG